MSSMKPNPSVTFWRSFDELARTPEFQEAIKCLEVSHCIFFLGFGYHEMNLKRLKIDKLDEFLVEGKNNISRKIVGTATDLGDNEIRRINSKWKSQTSRRSKVKDPYKLTINCYRVLLTRGRDGFIIYIPPEDNMESSYKSLLKAGLKEL